MTVAVEIGGREYLVELRRVDGRRVAVVNGRALTTELAPTGHFASLLIADAGERGASPTVSSSYEVAVARGHGGGATVWVNGTAIDARLVSSARLASSSARAHRLTDGPHRLTAPMPGRVVKLLVAVGQSVDAQQGLVVIEAMKMENELRAPRAGTVIALPAAEGTALEAGAVVAVIE